ncbi:MAG: hypothetical protein Kow0010_02430 [Dehalococcoidia bacterium]
MDAGQAALDFVTASNRHGGARGRSRPRTRVAGQAVGRAWQHRRPLGLALFGAAVLFAVDVAIPLGVAAAVPYAVLVLATVRARLPALTCAMAVLATVLTAGGFLLSPSGSDTWQAVTNRVLAVAVTWVAAAVVLDWLRAERRRLEQERARSVGALAGGMAHELNNLLTALMGNAALLRHAAAGAGQPYVQEIERAAARAADLVNNVLAYSGRVEFVLTPTDVNDVVSRAVLVEQRPATVVVEARLDASLPPALADGAALFNVVRGLLRNAIEALARQGGVISVATSLQPVRTDVAGYRRRATRWFVCLEVGDNGPGMTDETRLRAFEPFFTTREPGRGLGLAAIRGIVQALGGDIALESAPGAGTTVRVLLPALGQRDGRDMRRQ